MTERTLESNGIGGRISRMEFGVPAFRTVAESVLSRFREAIERAVSSCSNGLSTSRDLMNVLSVDRNVSWQIYKLLGPVETLSLMSYVPAPISIRKLAKALREKNVEPDQILELEDAFASLEEFVRTTAGDRDRFETMVMSFVNSSESQQADLQHRKSRFNCDCHFMGCEADIVVDTMLYRPGASPELTDVISIRQMNGLRRWRPSAQVDVEYSRVYSDAEAQGSYVPKFFDPEAARRLGASLLPEFCTSPCPELETRTEPSGLIRTKLSNPGIGLQSKVDLVVGRYYTDVPQNRPDDGSTAYEVLFEIRRPTRLAIFDLFTHRPTYGQFEPVSGVYAHNPRGAIKTIRNEGVEIPIRETLSYVGTGSDIARIREAPRYPEVLRFACGQLGWNLEEMDLYRLRIEYPLMDSSVFVRVSTPPAGQ